MPAVETYSPDPNILERKFAVYLARRGAEGDKGDAPSLDCIDAIDRVTKWIISLSAVAGLISGGIIGGAEIWVRQGYLADMEDAGWRETLPYWSVFYAFVGVISAIEIALLYALALTGIARITRYSGLPLVRDEGRGLLAHSLARAALEFPSPRVAIYGIDPYAHVSNWKLTALSIAYKLKVGVSSFLLRVFLRRVAARVAIRGVIPLFAAPLYAVWNAYIIWRIMTEARLRTLGPFAVDALIATHFQDAAQLSDTEKDVILHAAGEMLTQGRDAHPNQIYLMSHLRNAMQRTEDIALEWAAMRDALPTLDPDGQTRVLDMLTVSCVIGTRIHRGQMAHLRGACHDCGATLHEDRVNALRKALTRGHAVNAQDLAATRGVG